MRKVISATSIAALAYLSPHIASLSDKVNVFITCHDEFVKIMLKGLGNALTEAELITEVSSQRFWDTLMPLESVLDKIHFYVSSESGFSSGCPLDDAQIVMHVKPETVGCAEASKNRFDMDERRVWAPENNECKMLVFRVEKGANKDQVYAFVLPGNAQLDKGLTKELKLGVLDVQKLQDRYGIIPYTVNPFDFSSAVLSKGEPAVPTYIHVLRDQFDCSFVTNNCGSRRISLSVYTALYFELVGRHLQSISENKSSGLVVNYGLPEALVKEAAAPKQRKQSVSSSSSSPSSSSSKNDSGVDCSLLLDRSSLGGSLSSHPEDNAVSPNAVGISNSFL